MKILVTGAGSGLGLALRRRLGASGFMRGDWRRHPQDTFDAVVHCAHGRAKDVTDQGLADYLSDGPDLTAQALERCRGLFVLVSSISVYPLEGHDLRETTPIPLDAVTGFYGIAKLMSEARVRRWAEKTGRGAVILRLSSMLGPDSPRNATVRLIEGAETLPLTGDSELRYVTHDDVGDVVSACLGAGCPGPNVVETYNVSAPDAIRLDEVASLAGRTPRFGPIRYTAPPTPIDRALELSPSLRGSSRDRIIAEIDRRLGAAAPRHGQST